MRHYNFRFTMYFKGHKLFIGRFFRLIFGFVFCVATLFIFGRLTAIDSALIILSGVICSFFLMRDEAFILQELHRYFTARLASPPSPPAATASPKATTALQKPDFNAYDFKGGGASPALTDLASMIMRAEQQAATQISSIQSENTYRYRFFYHLPVPLILLDSRGRLQAFNARAKILFRSLRKGKPMAFYLRDNALIEEIQTVIAQNMTQAHSPEAQKPFIETELHFAKEDTHYAVLISGFSVQRTHQTAIMFFDRTDSVLNDRVRSDFVANVSHELKTPLTSIIGFAEILQGEARASAKTRQKFLNIIHQQSQQMLRLVSDQLSLARIERTERRPPEISVDIGEIAAQIVTHLTPQAQTRQAHLHLRRPDHPVMVKGDSHELTQMLQNLIENALRYGCKSKGDKVQITIKTPATTPHIDHDCCVIEVADSGEGIDAPHIPRLTERFYRIDKGRSREMGGTGLGLAIVKHIVTHHRGIMDIHSKKGKGSVFSVYLPLHKS